MGFHYSLHYFYTDFHVPSQPMVSKKSFLDIDSSCKKFLDPLVPGHFGIWSIPPDRNTGTTDNHPTPIKINR